MHSCHTNISDSFKQNLRNVFYYFAFPLWKANVVCTDHSKFHPSQSQTDITVVHAFEISYVFKVHTTVYTSKTASVTLCTSEHATSLLYSKDQTPFSKYIVRNTTPNCNATKQYVTCSIRAGQQTHAKQRRDNKQCPVCTKTTVTPGEMTSYH